MSERGSTATADSLRRPDAASTGSAGLLLRRAREAQGLPIESLAASIKVSVRKLESLEADRIDELPDATFARALAQTVCRTLKIDAAPVLVLLPSAAGHRIEQVSEGLNAPFRDRTLHLDGWALESAVKAAVPTGVVLILAALVYFLPEGSVQSGANSVIEAFRSLRTPSAEAAVGATGLPATTAANANDLTGLPVESPSTAGNSTAVETVFSSPAPGASGPADAPVSAASPLQLRASSESWIEVKDSGERVLMSRLLQPGETVNLDGNLPLRLKIGNAAVTEVRFRGAVVNITPMTTENIARFELK
jgi:cytoskeleton protein RodZ